MPTRDIKFRVWDGAKYLSHAQTPWLRYDGQLWSQSCCHWGYDEEKCEGNLVAEQYTGLHDSAGKPIYEGDVVNFTNRGITHGPEYEYIKNALVWWDDEDACWMFGRWYEVGLGGPYGYSIPGDRIDTDSFEVVGNLHETPELLNPTP